MNNNFNYRFNVIKIRWKHMKSYEYQNDFGTNYLHKLANSKIISYLYLIINNTKLRKIFNNSCLIKDKDEEIIINNSLWYYNNLYETFELYKLSLVPL